MLQGDLRKATEESDRNYTIFGKVQELRYATSALHHHKKSPIIPQKRPIHAVAALSVSAARNKQASESFVLELANVLADVVRFECNT